MARVPYVDPWEPSVGPELSELFSSIAGLRGSVHNLQRALANNPAALRAYLGMSRYVRDESSLAPRLRELAVLAVAHVQNVPYEIHYHVPAARRAGVPEEQIAAFPNWAASDRFDAVERAVLTYADQVARRLEVDDEVFEELKRHLSLPDVVDLVLVVAWYHLCSAVIVPLQIEAENSHP